MRRGTSPPNAWISRSDAPWIDLALFRKKPVDLMMDSSSPRSARLMAAGSGNRWKSTGVTMFTRASVHCAERIVAIRSSKGFRWWSAHSASGCARRSRSRRSGTSTSVLPAVRGIAVARHVDRVLDRGGVGEELEHGAIALLGGLELEEPLLHGGLHVQVQG